jgi:hypothetical protein
MELRIRASVYSGVENWRMVREDGDATRFTEQHVHDHRPNVEYAFAVIEP